MRRFPFDTVLTPLNHALAVRADYLGAYDALVTEVRKQDVGLMVIKSGSRRNWPGDERLFTTWYEPLHEQERIDATVAWVLSHQEVTGIATPSDVRLLRQFVQAEQARERWTVAAAEALLDRDAEYSSPFLSVPF